MQQFIVNMPKELHAKIKFTAFKKGDTMTKFIIEAIREKLERESVK